MRVLIDTNIALTYVSGREDPFSTEVDEIMRKCAEEEIEGAIAFHSLSTIGMQPENFLRRQEGIGSNRFASC